MMIRISSLLLTVLLMSGCTETYFSGNGSEALVYQETHTVQMNNSVNLKQQISDILKQVQHEDSNAFIKAEYKNRLSKRALQQALNQYTVYQVKNYRVSYQYNPRLDSDIKLNINMTKLKTEACRPAELSRETWQTNCFVETSRMRQVVDRSSLIGE